MSFQYKNPVSSILVPGTSSVLRDQDFGTVFSVNIVGGYQEVFYLSDLDWTIPNDILINGGPVLYSGNSIPISFIYNVPYSIPNTLNLNNDGISSGRRRLGMQVYVQETDTVYQYTMTAFTALWNAAELVGSIVDLGGGYEVYDDTPEGAAFIDAWTGSTIEDYNGGPNSRWQVFWGSDVQITGGTYFSGTQELDLYNSTGGTITISGFNGTVTGGTYNSGTGTLTLSSSDGSSFDVTGFNTGGGGSPLTIYDATSGVTATNVTGMTFSGASVIDNGGGNVVISFTGGTGTSGSSGTSGTDGSSGTSGTDGSSGTSGTDGSSGTSGADGSSGTSGTDGSSGSSGTDGSSGTSGTSGVSGIDGSAGTSGSSGTSGIDGSSGTSGSSGTDGSSGTSGIDGSSGTSGSSGTDGSS